MTMEDLKACLVQKQVLLTRLVNLSRQIETQCAREEPADPSPLILQRKVYLDRLKKCADRISFFLKQVPPEEKKRIGAVLSGHLPESLCSAEEAEVMKRELECRALLREISASDAESQKYMKKECDRLQKLVSDSRGKGERLSPLFHVSP